ncbi:MaoC family dehydratase [Rhodobacter sp. 24-YEA-8]|uniref:MaoC family dehydratase n=1 Tax=Rhodobacter sp. 24-YEA-8 TaxID=1884310 RepID=UPI00089C479E|nr:MaoC family dehydratase [Rhodobacter sp. 24-YEA-8]SED50602.1 3-hydroxybutyryl-CoA dehydratase [Rhodobacter sp. 24-YEA-8]
MTMNPIHEISIGESATLRRTVSESDVYLFAGISGDMHPNHVNREYAEGRFGGRVVHGALLPGYISACAVNLLDERLEPVGYAAQIFSVKCLAPVMIGDTVQCTVTVDAVDVDRRKIFFAAEVRNQRGELCATGEKVVKVLRPRPDSKEPSP